MLLQASWIPSPSRTFTYQAQLLLTSYLHLFWILLNTTDDIIYYAWHNYVSSDSKQGMAAYIVFQGSKLHSLPNGRQNYSLFSANKLQWDGWHLRLPCFIRMKCPEAEDKLYQSKLMYRDDAGRSPLWNRTGWVEGWSQNWDTVSSNWR